MADTINLPLQLYDETAELLRTKAQNFIDPITELGEYPTLYESGVLLKLPKQQEIQLYDGDLGVIRVATSNSTIEEVGENSYIATIRGALITFCKGIEDTDYKRCLHKCDVTEAYFKNKKLLGDNITIEPYKSGTQNFITFNFSENPSMPLMYWSGITAFEIRKYDEKAITVPAP